MLRYHHQYSLFSCVCVCFFFILLLLTTSHLIAFISQCTQQIEWWKKMEISLNNNKYREYIQIDVKHQKH